MERGKWMMDMKQRQYGGCEPWEFDGKRWRPGKEGARSQIRWHRDLDVFNPSTGSGQRLAYTLALWNNACVIGPTLWNETYSIGQPPCDDAYSTGLAMEVFRLTARFPKEERYALVDQMRRSSRGVCGNIACPVKYARSCVALL